MDNVEKLCVSGPAPWENSGPIGISPGTHTLKFVYDTDGAPSGKKAVIDEFIVTHGEDVRCLIKNYEPATAIIKRATNKIIRGTTQSQAYVKNDVQIAFTGQFSDLDYEYFLTYADEDDFYFVNEFGTCYYGIIEEYKPKSIALNAAYEIDIKILSNSTIRGFC